MADNYNAQNITILEGLEPVRKRPGMYIGGVGSAGLHHLVWEIVDNSIDEAMNGYATEITIKLHASGDTVSVTDNGRGIPVDKHPKAKKPTVEVILTTLHAGGKFEGDNYKTSGGLHGVGASVVNALSKSLSVTVKRGGEIFRMGFERGTPTTKLQKKKGTQARGSGTEITFTPDPKIFPKTTFDPQIIRKRLEVSSFIHSGVKIVFEDDVNGSKDTFKHDDGIKDYIQVITKERGSRSVHEPLFTIEKEVEAESTRIELCLRWTEATDEHVRSYVNGIPTGSGGSHENGLRSGLGKAVRNYIQTHKLQPKGITLTADDLREGMVAVISVFIPDPQFQGQTKDKLNNPEVQPVVDNMVRPALEQWLNENGSIAEAIVARMIMAARAREASRAAVTQVKRKSATKRLNLPGKLSDCTNPAAHNSEIFIVEGDSAGGSAKQGRDRTHQAIFPLRGKVLNTESSNLNKVLQNKELNDLVTALGTGIGGNFDASGLRYQRVVLLADADSDGHHITTLLMTFFYRHMKQLIDDGHVYLACPPLYRVDIGKETYWAADEADRERIIEEKANSRSKIEITRFKGLGEMMPKTLWETTLNPRTRRLLKVDIPAPVEADRVMSDLMGKDASPRFKFIMDNAETAEELDI